VLAMVGDNAEVLCLELFRELVRNLQVKVKKEMEGTHLKETFSNCTTYYFPIGTE